VRFLLDPRVAPWAKVLAALALVYAIFPLDLVPDVVPVLGWLDDAGIVALGLYLLTRAWNQYRAAAAEAASPAPAEGAAVPPTVVQTEGTDVTRR
jgi:uncharacterized membrane protein YkvA (DUF1232 family)